MAAITPVSAPKFNADENDTRGISDSSASIAKIEQLSRQGALDNVALTKIGVEVQKIANEGKAWQSIQSNLKSGVATLSQVG